VIRGIRNPGARFRQHQRCGGAFPRKKRAAASLGGAYCNHGVVVWECGFACGVRVVRGSGAFDEREQREWGARGPWTGQTGGCRGLFPYRVLMAPTSL